MCRINGLKLEMIRKAAKMSQKALAQELGVTASTINNYESGKSNPSDEVVDKLCMILKVHKDDIEIQNIGFNFLNAKSKSARKIESLKDVVRVMTPEETENWIESKRVLSETEEKEEVEVAMQYPQTVGNKKYIVVDARLIHIPEWQRDTKMSKCMGIAGEFNESKFDPIKVYVDNGKLYVADGAHRVIAFILYNEGLEKGIMKIIVEVLNCTKDEAILTFLSQAINRKPMTVEDMYRAGIKANLPEYVNLKYFCEERNIQITSEDNRLENPIGVIKPSRSILRYATNDKEMLSYSVRLIRALGWSGSSKNALTLRIFYVLKKLYAHYGEDAVKEKLTKYCKGATYYESIIYPIKSNGELYDLLERKMRR